MREEIFIKIKSFCKNELEISDSINMEDLLSEVGIDSIGFMMLIVFIEEEYQFKVDDTFLEDESKKTFLNLVDYVSGNIGGNDEPMVG